MISEVLPSVVHDKIQELLQAEASFIGRLTFDHLNSFANAAIAQ
jgi:hypothetical protein